MLPLRLKRTLAVYSLSFSFQVALANGQQAAVPAAQPSASSGGQTQSSKTSANETAPSAPEKYKVPDLSDILRGYTAKDGKTAPTDARPLEDWNTLAIPPGLDFEKTTVDSSQFPEFTKELVRLQWRTGDPVDLWILKPAGVKNPPVILYLYSYPSNDQRYYNNEFCKFLTSNGFAAVGFVSALNGSRFVARPMKEWFVSDLQESLATTVHDVQFILNYLVGRGDFDMNRVGMFGDGSGASIALMAAAVDPRIKVLDLLDPWGDWPTWIATSPFVPQGERANYIKPEYLKKVADLEPVAWLPKVQAKEFRLQDAIFETTTPTLAKEKLRAAVPPGATVVVYKNLEEYRAAINGNKQMEWMHNALRAIPDVPTTKTAANVPQR